MSVKEKLSAIEFIKVLRGEYFNTAHDYAKFYREVQGYGVSVQINNVIVEDDIRLTEKFSYPLNIRISNSTFLKNLIISDATFNVIGVTNSTFKQSFAIVRTVVSDVHLISISVSRQMSFTDVICTQRVFIFEIENCLLLFTNNEFNRLSLSVENVDYVRIIGSKTLINWLHIDERNNCNIEILNVIINHLQFSGRYNESRVMKIIDSKIHWINFYSFQNFGKMLFHNIEVLKCAKRKSNIDLRQFFQKDDVTEDHKSELLEKNEQIKDLAQHKLNDIFLDRNSSYTKLFYKYNFEDEYNEQTKAEFKFHDVLIGNTIFKNFELKNFDIIYIIDTELTTIKFFNTILPTEKVKGNHESLYEVFNDLYSVAKNQNNKRDEIEYYKSSQKSLLKSMLKEKWYFKIPSIISLLISYAYSYFGTRWPQSLFLTLIIGGLFFCLMCCFTLYDLDFYIHETSWSNFKELSPYFIRFLNPAHNITFMDEIIPNASKSFWFVLFDLFGRIFISIGVFELIMAFRKYVRK